MITLVNKTGGSCLVRDIADGLFVCDGVLYFRYHTTRKRKLKTVRCCDGVTLDEDSLGFNASCYIVEVEQ
jgi:hypothetical protein